MTSSPQSRITPWVGRLIIANAVVLLLLLTLFTAPGVIDLLEFSPAQALTRPWTFITYMFVHGGLLHLAGNMLMLFVFGSPVEHRMGSRAFILYYLYCGVGAAVLGLALSTFMPIGPFIGASGAILGVALAFAMFWPDAELIAFPIPIPMRARTFVGFLLALDVVLWWLTPNDGVAHVAHVGGAAFGYLFFRLNGLSRRGTLPPPRPVERVAVVQSGGAESGRPTPVGTPRPQRRRVDSDPVAVEVDRVLDKISAQGLSSLTPAERRFLDEVSRQKKQDH
jgi:membrane associated rhomboid family serine protease